ncbi:cytohesin 4a-related [Anaeramoeba flamelloides]|uniref:Cytohesin 4a-related n=1 Tax=Anaeramoeba flamelloides TaxID=1746091 RepID=A0ABQ8XY12_9EUKA|nr:cytohesin 4a-related [Anaeramoeba flamelloides]
MSKKEKTKKKKPKNHKKKKIENEIVKDKNKNKKKDQQKGKKSEKTKEKKKEKEINTKLEDSNSNENISGSEEKSNESDEVILIESGSEQSDDNFVIFSFVLGKNMEKKSQLNKNQDNSENEIPEVNSLNLNTNLYVKEEEDIILSSFSELSSSSSSDSGYEKLKKNKKKKKNEQDNQIEKETKANNTNKNEVEIETENEIEIEIDSISNNLENIQLQAIMNIALQQIETVHEARKFLDPDQIKMKIENGLPLTHNTQRSKNLRRKKLISFGNESGVTDVLKMSEILLRGDDINGKKWSKWEEYDQSDEELEGYEYEYDNPEEKGQTKKLKEGIFQFNKSIKKGINYCVDYGIIEKKDVTSIARFLFETEGLGKSQVGEYLGLGNEFSNKVLKKYVECFDFTGLHIDEALRQYLGTFRIPGEAQKIDRIMETFAKHYCKNNPKVFTSSDTAYVLAFSMIMLNTDAHNDGVQNKMSKTQFFANCSGIDDGKDIPQDFLGDIYDRIVNNEIKLKTATGQDETITFINPEKKGWLTKQGGRIKTWKNRWFLLSYNCLYYFKAIEDKEPCGIIPLDDVKVDKIKGKGKKHKYVFEITSTSQEEFTKGAKFANSGQLVTGHHKSYIISATTEEEMEEWINEINNNIAGSQLGKIIDQKKNELNKKKN